MSRELRQLFAMVLIWGNINDPSLLWDRHKEYLYENLARSYSTEVALLLAYRDINDKLAQFRKLLERDFGISCPTDADALNNEKQIDRDQERMTGERMYAILNVEQQLIANEIFAAINGQNNNRCFFVDGSGGTGKTFLYKTLCHILNGFGIEMLVVAWTGIAANLLLGATTVHS